MTLQELLAKYDEKRNAEERRLAAQEQALFLAHPQLQALQAQKKELILQQLMAVMQRPGQKEQVQREFAAQAAELDARMAEYQKQHQVQLPQMAYECPLCQDTGL